MNMKMGRRMKGKNSFKKDKMNIRWNEGDDEADYYTNTTEIVGRSVSEALPQEYVDHLPGTAGQRGQKTLNGQVEDSPGKYPNVKPAVRMKDSVPNRTIRMKDFQTSSSGKFFRTQLTLERGTLKYLKCSVFILLTFSLQI
ncbi:ankyrin repeat domain-containing protein 30B-like [Moschus berezovskii]|uniref:ankyrin repeat domain-containing protein 30B-like n=1 Tax=Moschus berezovskii TaxID=68408 RepID=UPI0024450AB7|nr:ankyrin repeat domain-containing protein 30B-like [Moschus berezovskii]